MKKKNEESKSSAGASDHGSGKNPYQRLNQNVELTGEVARIKMVNSLLQDGQRSRFHACSKAQRNAHRGAPFDSAANKSEACALQLAITTCALNGCGGWEQERVENVETLPAREHGDLRDNDKAVRQGGLWSTVSLQQCPVRLICAPVSSARDRGRGR